MTPPDPERRRALLWVAAGTAGLAGCGVPERTTPNTAPPPNGTAGPGADGVGPGPGEDTPAGDRTVQRGTGTPRPVDVVFTKPAGGEVPSTRYGSGDCGVVLVPQADRDRQSWDQYARRLAGSGYLALAIDEGERRKAAGVTAAVRYLREEAGVDAVVVIAASAGGEAAVRAVAERGGADGGTLTADETVTDGGTVAGGGSVAGAVAGLVVLSPAGGAEVAGRLSLPTLVVVAEGDADRYVETARALADGATGEAELATYEGDAHGQALLSSDHAEDLRGRIGDFLDRVCGDG